MLPQRLEPDVPHPRTNERPRSQQWNRTVDREITPASRSARVRRLPRRPVPANRPLNAIDPSFLSLGPLLDDEFQPGMASLNGVPLPYAGWVEQMTSCAPTVAQALLPYPQYCSSLQGLNENHGESTYHSLQAKVEKRFSRGTYFLVSYTLGRIYTSGSDNTQSDATTWSGASGSISPFEESRNRALATDDVTHVLSAALVWDLPIARDSDRCRERASSAGGSSRRSSATRRASRSSSARATATSPASSGRPASRRRAGTSLRRTSTTSR